MANASSCVIYSYLPSLFAALLYHPLAAIYSHCTPQRVIKEYHRNMGYHYYIGLQLPQVIRNQISLVQRALFDPIESVEPLEPHITLLPPPVVEKVSPGDLALHAKAAAQGVWPLHLTLSEVTTYGGHAIALRVEGDAIYELQRQLASLLPFATEVTYYPHPNFQPHVTLVQAIRGKKLPQKLIEQYKKELGALLPLTFSVDHLTLFNWTGPRKYEAKPI
jgi:2'-5' RNA ligase